MKSGILVTGTHRSGTTWVGKILSLPRNVVYIHEPFNIDYSAGSIAYRFKNWFTYADGLSERESEALRKAFHDTVTYQYLPPDRESESRFEMAKRRLLQRLRNARNRWQGRIPLVKDPIALLSAEFLALNFDLDVVCMIRHPLSFCGSLKKWDWRFPFKSILNQPAAIDRFFPEAREEIEQCTRRPPDVVSQGILLWNLLHRVIWIYKEEHPDWIFANHEDLVACPEDGFARICWGLGMPFSDEIRRGIANSVSTSAVAPSDPFYRPRNRDEVVRSWESRLELEEVDRILRETEVLRKEFYPENEEARWGPGPF